MTTLPRSNVTAQFIFLDTMRTFITFALALALVPSRALAEPLSRPLTVYLGPNNEQQDMWLEDTLQKSTADWLFVCGHHPVYSAGRHGPTPRLVNQLRPLLEKYKVAAYFCGHDHNLQHIQGTRDLLLPRSPPTR